MAVKEKDFVEIEFTGKLKEEGIVFDTTDAKLAKESGLPDGEYGPLVVCIGQGQLLKGLDRELQGKEPGKYTIELSPEDAFGKKDAKLIQMVPATKFKDQNVQPVPGLRLNVNGMIGVVRNVTGGRVLVDFNHPLSGRDVIYEVKINKIVTDKNEQLNSLLKMGLGIPDAKISIEGDKAVIEVKQKLPEPIIPEVKNKIKELVGVDVEIKIAGEAEKKEAEEKKEEKPEEKEEVKEQKPEEKKEAPGEPDNEKTS